jgi:acyl dehydratase
MAYMYFEDFEPGQRLESQPVTMNETEIIDFAKKFDPQLMHTDPEAAKAITGGLIASGWHTASMTMHLLVTSGMFNPAPGALGLGFESLKWLKPVRPGDALRLQVEVLSARASETKPDRGIVTNKFVTVNQHDEPVQEMISSVMIPKRKV